MTPALLRFARGLMAGAVVFVLLTRPMTARADLSIGPLATNGTLASTESTVFTNGWTGGVQNATGHTYPRLLTDGSNQYVVFYGADTNALGQPVGSIVLGKRALPDGAWSFYDTGFTLNLPDDPHEVPAIGIDGGGYIHLLWRTSDRNFVQYARSANPGDISSMTAENPQTSGFTGRAVYPRFFRLGSDLLVAWKDDFSPDNSKLWLKKWVPTQAKWISPVKWASGAEAPIIDGEDPPGVNGTPLPPPPTQIGLDYHWGQYFNVELAPTDGAIRLVWTWVPSGGSDSTVDLSYLVSHDEGKTWLTMTGQVSPMPVFYWTTPSARLFPGVNVSCINAVAADSAGTVHIAYLRPDDGAYEAGQATIWNYHHAWIDSTGVVHDTQLSHFTTPVGHPCIDAHLGVMDIVTSGQTVVGVLRPDYDTPWYVWRSQPPYVDDSFYLLGATARGIEEPNIDHTGWTQQGELMMLNDYLSPGSSTPSPDLTVSTTDASSILLAP